MSKPVIPVACPYCEHRLDPLVIPINWGSPPSQWSLTCGFCHATIYFDAPAETVRAELEKKGVL